MREDPQRRFDLRDFDETHPGPFEWDIKRLAASVVVAARENRIKPARAAAAVTTSVEAYRRRMRRYTMMPKLDIWYDGMHADRLISYFEPADRGRVSIHIEKKRKRRTSRGAFAKLTTMVHGRPRITEDPPIRVTISDDEQAGLAGHLLAGYRQIPGGPRQAVRSAAGLDKYVTIWLHVTRWNQISRSSDGTEIGPLAVRRSIWIDAKPERVWEEFETFERMKLWFGTGHTLVAYEPHLGGLVETDPSAAQGEPLRFAGRVTVYDPPRELTFEQDWLGHGWAAPSLITLRLTPMTAGTLVELFHHGFERLGPDAAENHRGFEAGWGMTQLEALRQRASA